LYKDAKLKFKMTFEQFPRRPPKVIFVSEIYHPMVDAETGELDLGEEITKNWNYGTEHLIFTIIEHVRLIFIDVKKY
jgi:ubiquitin-protein ligase